jgi:uncharacterized RDD family membrane protein YckC
MENAPQFETYSYEELKDAKRHIDKEQYPERYNKINELLHSYENHNHNDELISDVDRYATFWPRFGAAIIDGILFAIVLYLECLLFGIEYSNDNNLLQAFNGIQISVYFIFMHGLYGQTLGKIAVGVKVLNCEDEKDINVRQALKRESVNLTLNTLWLILIFAMASDLGADNEISQPLLYSVALFGLLSVVWAVSEFVTMLFNDKRRALHDFIGGTVVVRT